jgi:hypothetical protein
VSQAEKSMANLSINPWAKRLSSRCGGESFISK